MLRRCVLAHDHCLGVDLEWWATEEGPTVSHPDPNAGPTKVLMGTFLSMTASGHRDHGSSNSSRLVTPPIRPAG